MTAILTCDNSGCRFNTDARCTAPESIRIDAGGSCATAEYRDGEPPSGAAPPPHKQDTTLRDTDWFKSI